MRNWRKLRTRQRLFVSVPIGTSFAVMVISLFRGQLSTGIVVGGLTGALAAMIAAAWLRAEDPLLNPQRFAGKLRYDDTTGRARLVPNVPASRIE